MSILNRIILEFFIAFVILAGCGLILDEAFPAEVTVAWDAPPDASWSTVVSVGTAPGIYTAEYTAAPGATTATITNMQPAKTYYIAARHYYQGEYSVFSNELTYTPPDVPLPVTTPLPDWAGQLHGYKIQSITIVPEN